MAGTLSIILGVNVTSRYLIQISDLTQPYSGSNTTGWIYNPPYATGGPNPYISDILTAILQVTLPDGTVIIVDLLAGASPLYDIANSVINNPFVITPVMLGLTAGSAFPDGKYIFYLQVTGTFNDDPAMNFNSNPTEIVFIQKSVECCVQNLWKAAKSTVADCCNSPEYKKWAQADLLLKGIEYSKDCYDWTSANEQLDELQSLCAASGCGCGC